jgi:hypothetical protein
LHQINLNRGQTWVVDDPDSFCQSSLKRLIHFQIQNDIKYYNH